MAKTHSPLPWHYDVRARRISGTTTTWQSECVVDALGGHVICGGHYYEDGADLSRADAEFIVRAVNNFDDLLAACKAMVQWFDRLSDEQHRKTVLGQTLESAAANWDAGFDAEAGFDMTAMRAAIAKAEG